MEGAAKGSKRKHFAFLVEETRLSKRRFSCPAFLVKTRKRKDHPHPHPQPTTATGTHPHCTRLLVKLKLLLAASKRRDAVVFINMVVFGFVVPMCVFVCFCVPMQQLSLVQFFSGLYAVTAAGVHHGCFRLCRADVCFCVPMWDWHKYCATHKGSLNVSHSNAKTVGIK